jgi:hypothetical protein
MSWTNDHFIPGVAGGNMQALSKPLHRLQRGRVELLLNTLAPHGSSLTTQTYDSRCSSLTQWSLFGSR